MTTRSAGTRATEVEARVNFGRPLEDPPTCELDPVPDDVPELPDPEAWSLPEFAEVPLEPELPDPDEPLFDPDSSSRLSSEFEPLLVEVPLLVSEPDVSSLASSLPEDDEPEEPLEPDLSSLASCEPEPPDPDDPLSDPDLSSLGPS
jgi:hypothetical protein